MQRSRRRGALLAASLLVVTSGLAGGSTASADSGGTLDRANDLRLDSPLTGNLSGVDTGLLGATGEVEISIRLAEPAGAAGGNAATIASQQAAVTSAITAAGGRVEGSVDTVLNAVFATIDAAGIESIVSTGVVSSVKEVAHYELDLDETVPYIGGTAVQNTGNSGAGITVAVLDSGVDYTHADLGGGGTLADYEAAHGVNCAGNAGGTLTCDTDNFASRDGLFPTAKVIEGFDFVGEEWPNGPRTEDDDPIDWEGHGTHVADIIAGAKGVAPDASIVGVKVCSAVSSSCNGIALIKGMEYSVDQGVDIINMSLGSNYGQAFDDDLSAAADNATLAGVLTVSSAGNGSNKPYIQGSPAAASTVLSVAQTAVPGAVLPFLTVLGSDGSELASLESVFQDWSLQPDGIVGGPFQFADGAGGNANGCAPFAPRLAHRPGGPRRPRRLLVHAEDRQHRRRRRRGRHHRTGRPRRPVQRWLRRHGLHHRRRAPLRRHPGLHDQPGRQQRPQGQRRHLDRDRSGQRAPARRHDGRLVVPRPVDGRQPHQARNRRTRCFDLGRGGHRYRRHAVRRHVRRFADGGRRRCAGPQPTIRVSARSR